MNTSIKFDAYIAEALGKEPHKDLPPNIAFGDIILWTQIALAVILLIAIVLTIRTWVRRPAPTRTRRRTLITIASALILGLGTTSAIMIGIPTAIDFSWQKWFLTAPDLTLNFWVLAAETAVLALFITARQLAWRRKTAAASG